MTVSRFHTGSSILTESPVWHKERDSCFWVDIQAKKIFEQSLDGRRKNQWQLDHRVSLIIPFTDKKLILGLQGGIAVFDLTDDTLTWKCAMEKHIPANRCNDGACDSKGRLWVGTMNLVCKPMAGALYCIDEKAEPVSKVNRLSIPNGLTWSLDNKIMYHIDSLDNAVQAYHFDEFTGSIIAAEKAIVIPGSMGSPDGMCIDEEGMLWIAHWGGFAVRRWNPFNGGLLETIILPVPQVSSCAFVGEQLDKMLVTTASENMTEEDLARYPDSGNVYLLEGLKVKGIPRFTCKVMRL